MIKHNALLELNVSIPPEHVESANKYFNDVFCRLPANTQRAYKSDLKSFYQFCFVNSYAGLTPDIKDTEQAIRAFVTAMCESQLSYNTIVHRMATLSKFLKIAKLPDPLKQSEYLRDFIKLEMREHDIYHRANQAPALRLSILEQINEHVIPDTLLDIRDLAMINLMFDALLRADELASVQLSHIDYAKNRLLVPKSKADQSGKGSYRYVSNTSIAYISDYIKEANFDTNTKKEKLLSDLTRINQGILFRAISPKGTSMLPYDESITRIKDMVRINYTTVYRALKRIAKKANIDIPISGHSPRVGGAVSMAESGATITDIQKAGDWKTLDMPGRYTEQAVIESGMGVLARKHNR